MQFQEFLSFLHRRGHYHMKFLEFLFHFQKHGLSYAVNGISILSLKTWSIICNFLNFFTFSKNVDYHMEFMKFLFLLQKCGLSYGIYEISIPSLKTWTIICNF